MEKVRRVSSQSQSEQVAVSDVPIITSTPTPQTTKRKYTPRAKDSDELISNIIELLIQINMNIRNSEHIENPIAEFKMAARQMIGLKGLISQVKSENYKLAFVRFYDNLESRLYSD